VIVTEYCQPRRRSPGVFHANEEITSEPAYLLQQLAVGRFGDTHDDFSVCIRGGRRIRSIGPRRR